MILDITSLLSGEKSRLDFDYTLEVNTEENDNSVNLYGVDFPDEASVKGYITDNAGYMHLILSVTLPYITFCARCAKEVKDEFHMDFERTVVTEGIVEDAEEKEDDFAVAVNGMLDLDSQIIEIMSLEFPQRVLCKEDCKGLCQKCGKDLNEGDCGCSSFEPNPAFAALLKRFEEENKE